MIKDPRDIVVTNPEHIPKDTPEVLKFSPKMNEVFAVGSWDRTVRIYQIVPASKQINQQLSINMDFPIIDMDWSQDGQSLFVATGHSTSNISKLSLASAQSAPQPLDHLPNIIGLRAAVFGTSEGFVAVSFSGEVLVWVQGAGPGGAPAKLKISLQFKPTAFDIDSKYQIIIVANREKYQFITFNDLQNNPTASPKIHALDFSPKGLSAVAIRHAPVGGVQTVPNSNEIWVVFIGHDGRVRYAELQSPSGAISQLSKSRHIIFKPHTDSTKPSVCLYVASQGFHPSCRNSMTTSASDGSFTFWDTLNRVPTTNYKLPSSQGIGGSNKSEGATICCHDYSINGQYLAGGIGYAWNRGVWGTNEVSTPPSIFVHGIIDEDVREKPKR